MYRNFAYWFAISITYISITILTHTTSKAIPKDCFNSQFGEYHSDR